MSVQTLSFYTTGEGITKLVKDFISEGSYKTAYEILDDGGLNLAMIKKVFLLEAKFEGDTRNDGSLNLILIERDENIDYVEFILTGIRTALKAYEHKQTEILQGTQKEYEDDVYANEIPIQSFWRAKDEVEDIKYLFKVFERHEITNLLYRRIINNAGFNFAKPTDDIPYGGVILPNGEYILCSYDEHKGLYPILSGLGFADSSNWTDDDMCVHISSNQITNSTSISNPSIGRHKFTDAQLHSLFQVRNKTKGGYGENRSVVYMLHSNVCERENFGGKYDNLIFLKTYYTNINLPKFSKSEIPDVKNCIRTSPLYSLPGLLESKFDLNENSIKEIEDDFEKYKDIINGNKLYYFYQEYLEGANGVCHCLNKGEVTYMLSDNRGDVVNGIKSNKTLPAKAKDELERIAMELYEDFNNPIQLEFVLCNDVLYIVQLRLLKNNYDKTVTIQKPDVVFSTGKTFSFGTGVFDISEILIVDTDADSKQLLGKKALIVLQDVEFSHVLALSKSLGIPSMYAMSNIKFPSVGKIKIQAYNKEGWVELNVKN